MLFPTKMDYGKMGRLILTLSTGGSRLGLRMGAQLLVLECGTRGCLSMRMKRQLKVTR